MALLSDAGYGYDEFGANESAIRRVSPWLRLLHDRYFRVTSFGIHNIPADGPIIVVANHSGSLPFDAAMIVANVLFERQRLLRPVADRFLPSVPFVGTALSRLGAVTGSRGNIRFLLERGAGILIFPEGTTGIGKRFTRRYHLQDWRVGHAELALQHRVMVLPVAVIGAEEQMPQVGRIVSGARYLGLPYIPIAIPPLPLPVKYRLHYGAPIDLCDYDADDATSLAAAAAVVKGHVADLIAEGLSARDGIFT